MDELSNFRFFLWLFLWFFLIGIPSAGISAFLLRTKRTRISRIFVIILLTMIVLLSCDLSILPFLPPPLQKIQITSRGELGPYIITSVPSSVEKEKSIHVKTSLTFSMPRENKGEIQYVARPTPAGTPRVLTGRASEYVISVKARLSASAFDVDPKELLEEQYSAQAPITFYWTATPKYAGKQALVVTVTEVWTPKSGGILIERPLAYHSFSLDVSDTPPSLFSLGQIDLGMLLGVLLGSALNIPWIIELIKKMHERRGKRFQTSHTASAKMTRRRHRRKRS